MERAREVRENFSASWPIHLRQVTKRIEEENKNRAGVVAKACSQHG
jgi:hypothetical protein